LFGTFQVFLELLRPHGARSELTHCERS